MHIIFQGGKQHRKFYIFKEVSFMFSTMVYPTFSKDNPGGITFGKSLGNLKFILMFTQLENPWKMLHFPAVFQMFSNLENTPMPTVLPGRP
jgi:hypothetical protein